MDRRDRSTTTALLWNRHPLLLLLLPLLLMLMPLPAQPVRTEARCGTGPRHPHRPPPGERASATSRQRGELLTCIRFR
eukprot:COSAG06_NODE_30083_length_545_cov_0.704036_1_plen_78_part_00